jgi:hypothetical protein
MRSSNPKPSKNHVVDAKNAENKRLPVGTPHLGKWQISTDSACTGHEQPQSVKKIASLKPETPLENYALAVAIIENDRDDGFVPSRKKLESVEKSRRRRQKRLQKTASSLWRHLQK